MTLLMVYMLIGAVGKLTDLFGFEAIHSESGTENAAFSMLLSVLLWPIPFVAWVKANLLDE